MRILLMVIYVIFSSFEIYDRCASQANPPWACIWRTAATTARSAEYGPHWRSWSCPGCWSTCQWCVRYGPWCSWSPSVLTRWISRFILCCGVWRSLRTDCRISLFIECCASPSAPGSPAWCPVRTSTAPSPPPRLGSKSRFHSKRTGSRRCSTRSISRISGTSQCACLYSQTWIGCVLSGQPPTSLYRIHFQKIWRRRV